MRAFVRIRYGQSSHELSAGDLIGRVSSASLHIDDPRVSEAHAIVSWRYGALWLLSLRRLIALDGKPLSKLRLASNMQVDLADGVRLYIEEVVTPKRVIAIQAPGFGLRPLPQVSSLYPGPPPRVVGRFIPDATVHIWWSGKAWSARDDKRRFEVAPGDTIDVRDCKFQICTIGIDDTAALSTKHEGAVATPMHIIAYYSSVEIHRAAQPVLTIAGLGAQIISELIAFDVPVEWKLVAREIWNDPIPTNELRQRWDAALNRLRKKLRNAGIRSDLLQSDGVGGFQFVLYSGDSIEDQT